MNPKRLLCLPIALPTDRRGRNGRWGKIRKEPDEGQDLKIE